jgi:dipeptidyl aminopeptidase/acylaminoacyl peptidase
MIAPVLSLVGLIVVAIVTLSLFNGHLPTAATPANGGQGPVAGRTPTPSNVIDVNPRADVPGSIVYVKAGNLWIQIGKTTRMITNTGTDTMPSWSPDGKWIYFIETRPSRGTYAVPGDPPSHYTENYPVVSRIRPDGTGRQAVKTGLFTDARGTWFSWIRQPVLSPDGRTLAICSDGPDPSNSDVVLQFYDLQTRRSTIPRLPENPPLGHQDPAWSPDGRQLLYVKMAVRAHAARPRSCATTSGQRS